MVPCFKSQICSYFHSIIKTINVEKKWQRPSWYVKVRQVGSFEKNRKRWNISKQISSLFLRSMNVLYVLMLHAVCLGADSRLAVSMRSPWSSSSHHRGHAWSVQTRHPAAIMVHSPVAAARFSSRELLKVSLQVGRLYFKTCCRASIIHFQSIKVRIILANIEIMII